MTVGAVGQNENSHLSTIVKSTALGTAAGYSLKYFWPVTKQENDFNPRTVINYCRKVTNKNCVAEFKLKPQLSPAQDMFIKMIENEDKIKRSTSTVWVRPEGIEHEAFISDSLFAGDGVHRVEIERMASNINGEIKDDCLITSTGDYPIDLTSRFSGDFESKHKCFVEKDVQLDSPRVSLEDILHQGFPDMDGYSGFSSCESSNYRQLFSEHEANIERAKSLYTMLPTNKKTSSIVR